MALSTGDTVIWSTSYMVIKSHNYTITRLFADVCKNIFSITVTLPIEDTVV